MAYYRVYCLDLELHIIDVEHFEAADDAAAVLKVEADNSCFIRELWNRDRKVRDFERPPPPPVSGARPQATPYPGLHAAA